MPIHTGEFTLTAKVADHVLEWPGHLRGRRKTGRRRYVIYNGSVIKADENGRFRIDGLVAGKLELHASPDQFERRRPRVAQIEMPETPTEIEHTITLPRGLVVTGRVVDEHDRSRRGKGPGRFQSRRPSQIRHRPLFSLLQGDRPGRTFRLVVPPGRGTVVLRTIPTAFPQPERRLHRATRGPQAQARGLRARRTDDRGRGIQARNTAARSSFAWSTPTAVRSPDAQVDVRDPNRLFERNPRPLGRRRAIARSAGSRSNQSTVVDIIDANGSLGATIEIPDAASAGANKREIEVRLQPLCLAFGPRARRGRQTRSPEPIVHLYRNVIIPVQSGRSFGLPIETLNEIKADGTYTFDHLIPGATYNTQVEVSGYPNATSDHVTVKPDQPVRLNDFRLPTVDQEVNGIVVDPRGKPLAGVIVSFERTGQHRLSLYAPSGGSLVS